MELASTVTHTLAHTTLFRSSGRSVGSRPSKRAASRSSTAVMARRLLDLADHPADADERHALVARGVEHQRLYHRLIDRLLGHPRSEEHTSELQSRENLVCRL